MTSDTYDRTAAVRALPELPGEFARDLEHATSSSVLITAPGRRTGSSPPLDPPVEALGRSFVRVLSFFVSYPVTRCSPVGHFEPETVSNLIEHCADRDREGGAVGINGVFRLSGFAGTEIDTPAFCWVDRGPWYVKARWTTSCVSRLLDVWEFPVDGTTVGGSNMHLEWFGDWDDMPDAFPELTIISQIDEISENWTCCGKTKRCGDDCIPWDDDCDGSAGGGTPA